MFHEFLESIISSKLFYNLYYSLEFALNNTYFLNSIFFFGNFMEISLKYVLIFS